VDSEELTVGVDSEKVNENGIGADWEIIIETPSKGEAWIQQSSQPGVNENGVGTDWKIFTETPFKGDAWIQKS
jgi:hypothetical protein